MLFYTGCTFFYLLVALRYELQMQQQNSYRNNRYLRWLKTDLIAAGRIINLVLLLSVFFFSRQVPVVITVSVALIIKGILELRRKYKKKLVFTSRSIRLYVTSCIIGIIPSILYLLGIIPESAPYLLMVPIVLAPLILMAANLINSPLEKAINRRYYQDAKRILAGMPGLTIIGITGSYGKTSTKHYLFRLLSEKYNVLMTPGSYNTTLGVIRTIREELKPFHEVFIVEMGAKQPGDIAEICQLVNPGIGILTAVGEQHLESFKTIQRVQQTKFELIDALPSDGLAVLNDDFEYIANRPVKNLTNVVRYSSHNTGTDFYISNVKYETGNTCFSIVNPEKQSEEFTTKLVGSYNLSNVLACYIVGLRMGLTPNSLRYAIGQIEQVEHRLSIKHHPNGITVIDDAFNSNPQGAQMALEVIKSIQTGKRIVVTPGMIELGEKQYDYNYQFGVQMATSCDYVIVVGQYNREAIVKGLQSGGSFPKEQIFPADTFKSAVDQLNSIIKPGDAVLYENDLPDTFK